MKDTLIVIGLSIAIIPYALICVIANLYKYLKANNMTLKERVNYFINEEIESIKYSQFFINR